MNERDDINEQLSRASDQSIEEEIVQFKVPGTSNQKPKPAFAPMPTQTSDLISLPKNIWHKAEYIEKNFLKVFSIALMSLFMVSLVFVNSVHAEADARSLMSAAQNNITATFSALSSGDIGTAFADLDIANSNVKKLKLILQSFGQDIDYLRLLGGSKSQVVSLETVLDSSYNILNVFKIAEKNSPELAKSMGSKDGEYVFDIHSARLTILKLLKDAKSQLETNRDNVANIQNSLPAGFRPTADKIISAVNLFDDSAGQIESLLTDNLTWLSGEDGKPKNVMIIFQNNAELRGASGGSLGSFGIARLQDGKLKSIDFGTNIYKLDNPFVAKECIPVDNELSVVTDGCMRLKDSGWSVDGQEAMQNIEAVYKKESGNDLDGVVTIDTTAFTSLLKVVGPISMPEYNQTITSDNFRSIVENEVEVNYYTRPGGTTVNEPKEILSDMMPKFIAKLTSSLSSPEKFISVTSALSKSMKDKNILFYFNNSDFQSKIVKSGFAGNVTRAIGDYLYVNNSNIDGAKSSLSIDETLNLKVTISGKGTVSDSLDLVRKHNGVNTFPDGLNRNYIRLLLPDTSSISAFTPVSGNYQRHADKGYLNGQLYWLTNDAGKQDVNFWMNTAPGDTSELKLDYIPNYSVDTSGDFDYEITMQKQPGANADHVNLEINYPYGFKPTNVNNYDFINHKIVLKTELNSDQTIKINFQKTK